MRHDNEDVEYEQWRQEQLDKMTENKPPFAKWVGPQKYEQRDPWPQIPFADDGEIDLSISKTEMAIYVLLVIAVLAFFLTGEW